MPQIDTVAYFPIIFWSLLIIGLGYVFFNLYLFLNAVNMMKIFPQWKNYQVSLYWLNWNTVEVVDTLSYIEATAKLLSEHGLDKLDDSSQVEEKSK